MNECPIRTGSFLWAVKTAQPPWNARNFRTFPDGSSRRKSMYYVLNDDGEPVGPVDLATFARWRERNDVQVVWTELDDGRRVSTVFLGIDHSWGNGEPILYETMVFPSHGWSEMYCWRDRNRHAARARHERVVSALRDGEEPEQAG